MYAPPLPDRAGSGDLRRQVDMLVKEAGVLGQKDTREAREDLQRVLHRLDKVRSKYHKLYNYKESRGHE